jgi:hypothetical protein
MAPIISILICTIPKRKMMFEILESFIKAQVNQLGAWNQVEILSDAGMDKSIGTKRQELLLRSNGKYVTFCDDDDAVPVYYVYELLEAAKSNADCFAINGNMTTNGVEERNWWIAKDNPYGAFQRDGKTIYLRHPNHITPIRREIALRIGYKDLSFQEDHDFCVRLKASGLIQTEYVIERPMYTYLYLTAKTYT